MKNVVIVGGGFGGLTAAQKLGNKKNIRVTLIDRRNYHLFQPLLYQVAMAGLSPADIAIPIRGVLSKYKNIETVLENVDTIDLKNRTVITTESEISYDYLLIACGAKHSYFGHNEWEPVAPGLKTVEQATEIRRRVLMAYEKAERENNPETQKQYLTFVVVGGGPTGVELAGALGEISRYTLSKNFRHIDPRKTKIILIEAGDRILKSFAPKLSTYAQRTLEKLGVEVWLNTLVTDMNESGVIAGDKQVKAKTVIWAAGVKPSTINESLDSELDTYGRVFVEKDLSLKNHPEVFVIGDQIHFPTEDGEGLPGMAPAAMQQGRRAARNIIAEANGKPRKDFVFLDKGQMATIGRKKAVLEFHGWRATGFIAWFAWLVVHIYYLIGFKNRILVLMQWAWSYFNISKGARLITHKEWRSYPND